MGMVATLSTGVQVHHLTLLERTTNSKGRAAWLCRCACGREAIVRTDALQSGKTKSCGCSRGRSLLYDENLCGRVFGEWYVYKKDPDVSGNYICMCSCGYISSMSTSQFEEGSTSCGCRGLYAQLLGTKVGKLTVIGVAYLPNRRGGAVYCACDCGGATKVAVSNLQHNAHTRSCGCINLARGKDHYNYNPDLPDYKRQQQREVASYVEWRNQVYTRDNFTCQVCGVRGRRLNAHHMNSYSDYPDLRTSVDNGITMCALCHRKFHNQYGTREFTCYDLATYLLENKFNERIHGEC